VGNARLDAETSPNKGSRVLTVRRQQNDSIDESLISLMRLMLATLPLVVIYLDPAEPDRFFPATYAALVSYAIYSLAAAELFRMITEGLSNIRRHTHARVARTILSQQDGNVRLRVQNEDLNGKSSLRRSPRSLTERAAALGGQASSSSQWQSAHKS
jgi:hypothetical protein